MRLALVLLSIVAGLAVGCSKASPPLPPGEPDHSATPGPIAPHPQLIEPDEGPLPNELRQPAIAQDATRMAKLRAERLARARASSVDAYPKVGRSSPDWDAAAVAALAAVAESRVFDHHDMDLVHAAGTALDEAVERGCDDPLVRYYHVQFVEKRAGAAKPVGADHQKQLAAAARALRESRYPAVRRAHAAHNFAVLEHARPKTDAEADATLAHPDFVRIRELVKGAWADDPRGTAEDLIDLAEGAQSQCLLTPTGRDKAYQTYAALVAGLPDGAAVGLWLRGKYLKDRAWAARGNAAAQLVPADRMRQFVQDLEAARDALEAAWEADPTRPEVAAELVQVIGPTGDFEALDFWFERAMTLDGDCVIACQAKGNFLQARWGGHSGAARQFAGRLADTKNFSAGLPTAGVHLVLRLRLMPRLRREDVAVSEADWPLIERVYTDHLAARPDSRWAATHLMWLAWHNGRHATALAAADRLDGRPLEPLVSRAEYDEIRAAARAGVAAGHR